MWDWMNLFRHAVSSAGVGMSPTMRRHLRGVELDGQAHADGLARRRLDVLLGRTSGAVQNRALHVPEAGGRHEVPRPEVIQAPALDDTLNHGRVTHFHVRLPKRMTTMMATSVPRSSTLRYSPTWATTPGSGPPRSH